MAVEDCLPYLVEMRTSSIERLTEHTDWLTDNFGTKWQHKLPESDPANCAALWGYFLVFSDNDMVYHGYRFKHEEHAVWFALTWQ